MPKLAPVAVNAAAELLAAPPAARNAWIEQNKADHPRRVALLLRAVEELTGTPYGLWRDDPVGFVEVGLGETLWSVQRQVLQSLVEHPRTVVPSAHGTGKTHDAARAVAWFLCVHPPGTAKAITTATNWRQVRALLWMSPDGIKALHARANLPGQCLETQWKIGGALVAEGFSPADQDETAFSGYHAPNLLVVVDEAGGLSPVLGRSLESMMSTGHARMLIIGNPAYDETGSPWMEERCSLPGYHVIRIPAEATPNFTGEPTPLCKVHPDLPAHHVAEHLITAEWAQQIADTEGVDSAYYLARVQAIFPKDVQAKTIPRTWLEESASNESPEPLARISLGVDVAADGGDRFAIARSEGFTVRVVHSVRPPAGVTTFDLASTVMEHIEAAETLRRDRGIEDPVRVKIDALGIGMGVSDTLVAWGTEGRHDAIVVPVKVSERCTDERAAARYANQRAEMWWLGRILSQPDTQERVTWRLDVGDSVLAELNAPKYGRNSGGRILIEAKKDMAKRGIRSPDDAEAVLLAVYEPGHISEPTVGSAVGVQLPSAFGS